MSNTAIWYLRLKGKFGYLEAFPEELKWKSDIYMDLGNLQKEIWVDFQW